jgi:Predicted xylanase/chitin deacetylase
MEKIVSSWPAQKKLAVMVTVMFEVWSEGKAPPYSPMTTSLKPGTADLLGISWSQYGGKTGIWRFMRIFDDVNIKATICLNAKGAELFPQAVQQLHERGHEIAGHSYTQDLILPYLSLDEETEVIRRCKRIIEKTVGTPPLGWFSPVAAPTEHTAELLAREGFLWHGDYNDTDLPYVVETAKGAAGRDRAQRLHGQPYVAIEPARFFQRLQRHLRLSLQTRIAVAGESDRARALRRAAADVGDAARAAALHERLSWRLVRPPRRDRALGSRTVSLARH